MKRLMIALLFVSGCTHAPVQLYDLRSDADRRGTVDLGDIQEGEACQHWILYLVPVGNTKLNTALADMAAEGRTRQRRGGQVGLVTVERKTMVWLLGYTRCTVVTGYQVIPPRGHAQNVDGDNQPKPKEDVPSPKEPTLPEPTPHESELGEAPEKTTEEEP
ncbi:MAG: hypothetical protein GY854_19930 [Deltaproteobacteria bacterium]|nr:hypothetical protein [Deltaproteobacteria bacterium]